MDWEVEVVSRRDKLHSPSAHRLASPAGDSSIIYCLGLVGYHKLLVDTHNLAITLALGTCSKGVVEAEEVLCGVFKCNTIRLEA